MIHKEVRLSLRVSSTLKKRCEASAERAGLSLSDWLRGVLALAANQGAFEPPMRRRHGTKKAKKKAGR